MRKVVLEYLAVGGAGALGAMLRLFVSRIFTTSTFPLATFIINITGSLFLGWFLTVVSNRVDISEVAKLAIAVGFVGAYTTFSTYMYESDKLMQDGAWTQAAIYLAGSIFVGLLAVRAGIIIGQTM
jgi:CrcB protein